MWAQSLGSVKIKQYLPVPTHRFSRGGGFPPTWAHYMFEALLTGRHPFKGFILARSLIKH